MDWENVKWWAELLESMVVTIAAGVAVYAAFSWRRDFLSRRRLEVQEDVLTRMLELKALLGRLQGSLRYIEHQIPEPENGESTIALKLASDDVSANHELVLAKMQEIATLEVKARLLFEPQMFDVFRFFAIARITEFTKVKQLVAHISLMATFLENNAAFDANLVKIADQNRERTAKLLKGDEARPHSFEILATEIDKFCDKLALFRPTPQRVFKRSVLNKIRQTLKRRPSSPGNSSG